MKIVLPLFLALLVSCSSGKEKCDNPIEELIVSEAAAQKKCRGLELVALNIPDDCQKGYYYLHYLTGCPMKIDEVRPLVVEVVESFISRANQSELFPKEINANDLIVNFGFVEEDGSFHEPPCVAYAYLKNGKVHYCYYDNTFGKFISFDDVKESYQEAKNKVPNKGEPDEN